MAYPKGRQRSLETKRKISETCKKVLGTPEAREKNRLRNLGNKYSAGKMSGKNNPMWGKKQLIETKEKIRVKAKGRKVSKETRLKLGLAIKGKRVGSKHPLWKGGLSFLPYSSDWTETLRRAVRERDRYSCQLCGELQGDKAHCVHHIDYDKKNNDPKNLITLCHSCHSRTNGNGRKEWTLLLKKKVKSGENG